MRPGQESPNREPLQELREELRAFASAREWDQFHSPRNLAIALSVEAAELLAHFQWQLQDDVAIDSKVKLAKIEEELADIFICLIRMCDKLDVDLIASARRKIATNANKYPVEKARGNAKKYSEL